MHRGSEIAGYEAEAGICAPEYQSADTRFSCAIAMLRMMAEELERAGMVKGSAVMLEAIDDILATRPSQHPL